MTQQATKKQNVLQAVINSDQKFILAKKINEISNIVCPFNKNEQNIYYTDFVISVNQIYRIYTLYEMITSGVALFTVSGNIITFDCTKKLPVDMFGDVTQGYIHYVSTIERNKETNENEIIVEPRIVFDLSGEDKGLTFEVNFNQKIKFKTEYLKVFPSILKDGFLLVTVDQQNCNIFMSIIDPSKDLVGECSRFEINNVIQHILPLWSIFDISISKDAQIKLRSEFLPNELKQIDNPIMISARYNLSQPESITIKYMANGVRT